MNAFLTALLSSSVSFQRDAVSHGQRSTLLMQLGVTGVGYLRDRWSEAEVLNLPTGEHDYFERKAGALLDDDQKRVILAKAVSAFANSGGGHIILGQEDDLTIDGVREMEGNTPTRDWLEQVIPTLLAYPLTEFRVHVVGPCSTASQIPASRQLIVIDVGDSPLAPHQAIVPKDKPTYYHRVGGHSRIAPHHYLEALRSRLVAAQLAVELKSIEPRQVLTSTDGQPVVEFEVTFEVKNISRVACYKWDIAWAIEGSEEFLRRGDSTVPSLGRTPGVKFDSTILPTLGMLHRVYFGMPCPGSRHEQHLLSVLLPASLAFRALSENYIGETNEIVLRDVLDFDTLDREIEDLFKAASDNA